MNLIRRNNAPLASYRPASIDEQFGRLVENMFDDFFAPFSRGPAYSGAAADAISSPRLNVVETERAYDIEAEMPGVKKEDVKVSVDKQRVTIEGEAKQETARQEGENVVYAERATRRFARTFTLPSEVDDEHAQARLEDGVLKVTLPKRQESQAKRLSIQ
ncbi:MAG: Hsp20/alpha crystallin family protein [Pseudomonadota bacterium]